MIQWADAIVGLEQANHFLSVLEQDDLSDEVQELIKKVKKRRAEILGGEEK